MLLNVKVENHIEKNTGNTGEGENILRVIIAVGCYKQTNKYNIASSSIPCLVRQTRRLQ